MTIALISDIHGNYEALKAVVNDIANQNIERVYCLGDVVGYGPNPDECLNLVREIADDLLLGNHDYALLEDNFANFSRKARDSIKWANSVISKDNREYLEHKQSKIVLEEEKAVLTHGCPFPNNYKGYNKVKIDSKCRNIYILPKSAYGFAKSFKQVEEQVKEGFPNIDFSFSGHTHYQLLYTNGQLFTAPKETIIQKGNKATVIVGSVGQPRNENPNAAYTIFVPEERKIIQRNVPYNIELTQQKIRSNPNLNNTLADRLEIGK